MILEAIDGLYGVGQLVGKTYGFIDPHDAAIQDVESDGRRTARFASFDAGWPELIIELPPDTGFHLATSGPLTRYGGWITPDAVSEVRKFLEPRVAHLGGAWHQTERGEAFDAAPREGVRTSIRISSTAKLGTLILIKQKRSREGLKASMMSRLGSLPRNGGP